ncbi:hypothetical protein P9112_002414 [Eukaryota sp. TZLM1-RC]
MFLSTRFLSPYDNRKLPVFSFGALLYITLVLSVIILPFVIPSFLDIIWPKYLPSRTLPSMSFNGEYLFHFSSSNGDSFYSSSSMLLNDLLGPHYIPLSLSTSSNSNMFSLNFTSNTQQALSSATLFAGITTEIDSPFMKTKTVLPLVLSFYLPPPHSRVYLGGSITMSNHNILDQGLLTREEKKSLCEYDSLEVICSEQPSISSFDVEAGIFEVNNVFSQLNIRFNPFYSLSNSFSMNSSFKLIFSEFKLNPTLSQSLLVGLVYYCIYFIIFRKLMIFVFKKLVTSGFIKLIVLG